MHLRCRPSDCRSCSERAESEWGAEISFRFADVVSEEAVKINGGGGEEERANGVLANAFVPALRAIRSTGY